MGVGVRVAGAWWEVLHDFLIEVEWFTVLDRPVCGFYRKHSYPAFRAVADLIIAINRSVTQLLPIKQVMLDLTEVHRIHTQRCTESPKHWAHTPQAAAAPSSQQPRTDRLS